MPEHLVPDEATQRRLEQEQRQELNQRQLHLEKLRLDGIAEKKAKDEMKAKLEADFARLQKQQEEERVAREKNELVGEVVASREEALTDAQQSGKHEASQRQS